MTPPGGITKAVDRQSWDANSVLDLKIRDNHLVIEPQDSFDYPWEAYSFRISNWDVIDQLWPRPGKPVGAAAE